MKQKLTYYILISFLIISVIPSTISHTINKEISIKPSGGISYIDILPEGGLSVIDFHDGNNSVEFNHALGGFHYEGNGPTAHDTFNVTITGFMPIVLNFESSLNYPNQNDHNTSVYEDQIKVEGNLGIYNEVFVQGDFLFISIAHDFDLSIQSWAIAKANYTKEFDVDTDDLQLENLTFNAKSYMDAIGNVNATIKISLYKEDTLIICFWNKNNSVAPGESLIQRDLSNILNSNGIGCYKLKIEIEIQEFYNEFHEDLGFGNYYIVFQHVGSIDVQVNDMSIIGTKESSFKNENDEKTTNSISFGNMFIIFIIFGILSLTIHKRKSLKTSFNF